MTRQKEFDKRLDSVNSKEEFKLLQVWCRTIGYRSVRAINLTDEQRDKVLIYFEQGEKKDDNKN